ncbi:MAG: Npt1/Npt2 family nucleotide transporter [Chlamydiota bacterium]
MNVNTFGKWRKRFWPVHAFELKKVVPLLLMKFLISFVYGILLSMKDTLIVTGEGSGAEVIPVLKGWVVLPIAVGVTLLYSKLANKYRRSTLFYGTIFCFLGFILLFSFVLYPNKEILSPIQSSNLLLSSVGQNYSHWIAVYRNWIQTLFFVVAEMWAPLVIFMLFWGFCNQINLVEEAKRYYTLFIVAGDLGTIFTGPLIVYYSRKFSSFDYIFTIQSLAICLAAFGLGIIFLHWWLVRYVLPPENTSIQDIPTQKKPKLSLVAGLRYIISSKYLRCIACMVVGYGLIINMVEVPWKAHVHQLYSNPADYQEFIVKITSTIGLVAMLTAFFVSGNVIRGFGWRFSAMIPPIVIGTTGCIFFLLVLLNKYTAFSFSFINPLFLIVYFGALQNVLSKAVKYSFFDPTKEMAFIPLDEESKVKGKAAIDVVGSRLGKSGSGWIQLAFMQLLGTSSVLSISGLLLPFIIVTMLYWMISIRELNQDFQKKSQALEVASEPTA